MYKMNEFLIMFCCMACSHAWSDFHTKNSLRVIAQWTDLKFNFPSQAAEQDAYQNRFYMPGNSIPIDVDVDYSFSLAPRIFITIPRLAEGRPVTLGIVDEQGRISPYPNYSWHYYQYNNCKGFISVFRTAIDECDRLWVLDTGKIGDTQVCPPQLVAFDLSTDRVLFRHQFSESTYKSTSLFVTPVVDIGEEQSCSGTFVYVADVTGFALVVVDVDGNRSWRINHKLFFPFPSRGTITISGESVDLMDGVLGMALSPRSPGQDRYLYFHALASTTENVVRTHVLQNDSFIYDTNADRQSINTFSSERLSQSAAEAIDRDGIMFFGLMEPPSIWCWNTAMEFTPKNFHKVALNRETLQFASGLKVINNSFGEQELWVLTSSFQKVRKGTINSNGVNFRIHSEKISKLLQNSPCVMSQSDYSYASQRNYDNFFSGFSDPNAYFVFTR